MRIRYLPLSLLVCVVLILWCFHSLASARVLVIHSFHADNEWVQQINAALFQNSRMRILATVVFIWIRCATPIQSGN